MHEKIVLENGVRIIVEPIDYVRSASVGIWVGCGSRHEPPELYGISHFIEHMVFKGTSTRTASEIAFLMDGIGGQVNAFTTKECTCFYAKALTSHLDVAINVLCDMFFDPRISEKDVKTERGVIIEEIGMYEDSPEDLVSERLFKYIFRGTPLAHPILGTPSSLKKINGEMMRAYMRENYRAGSVIVSLCGSYTQNQVDELKRRFSALPASDAPIQIPSNYTPAFTVREKDIEQNHVCLAFPGLNFEAPERYASQVMSGIVGSGMSSRLFQRVREALGLCYSVYSFSTAHSDTGIFGICTAVGKETEKTALGVIREELNKLLEYGVTEMELERTREQIKANVVMSLESITSRMNYLARQELFLRRISMADDIIESYDRVTLDDVNNICRKTFDFENMSLSAVGNVLSKDAYRKIFR